MRRLLAPSSTLLGGYVLGASISGGGSPPPPPPPPPYTPALQFDDVGGAGSGDRNSQYLGAGAGG